MGGALEEHGIWGTPARVIEGIERHRALGCSSFVIEFFGRDTRVPARLFAETVLPELSEVVGLTSRNLADLARLHLVDIEPGGAWRMHRLIRDFGQSPIGVEASRIEEAVEAFVSGCAECLAPFKWGSDPRPYVAHYAHLERSIEPLDRAPDPAELARKLGLLNRAVGSYRLAEERFRQAIDLAGEHDGTNASYTTDLALVLQDQGDLPAARTLLEQALEALLKVH